MTLPSFPARAGLILAGFLFALVVLTAAPAGPAAAQDQTQGQAQDDETLGEAATGEPIAGEGGPDVGEGEAEEVPHLDGGDLNLLWAVPFAGILLSIAIMPLVAPHFWHANFGKIAAAWSIAFLLPFALVFGFDLALYEALHAMLLEYVPFILLLFALFTVTGGIRVRTSLQGTPVFNTGVLALGTALASWMGTTGAAMVLIRPILRANAWRRSRTHVVVFFIFLVANIGGSLTPLGRSALVPGLLEGRAVLLADDAHVLADAGHGPHPARRLLRLRHLHDAA